MMARPVVFDKNWTLIVIRKAAISLSYLKARVIFTEQKKFTHFFFVFFVEIAA